MGALPCDVMNSTIKTVRQWESDGFRVFASFIEDDIMRQCKASDERFLKGKPISIFDGVPVAVKDMIAVEGHIMYNGKNPDEKFRDLWTFSKKDDILVARLRALGAIVIGTTIMTEGGVTPLGWSAQFKGPLNPYDHSRYSGGRYSTISKDRTIRLILFCTFNTC